MKKFVTTAVCLFSIQLLIAQIITLQTANAKELLAATQNNYFRVVVKGFTCTRETSDDILERDGKRDEIYLSSMSYLMNTQGRAIGSTTVKNRTRVMGDVNERSFEERRVMAGTAINNMGGIKTGDQIPDAEPWNNSLPAKGDLLPFILWEGELFANSDNVIIQPNIMEYDGPDDFLTNFWGNSLVATLLKPAVGIAAFPFVLISGYNINNSNIGNIPTYDDSQPGVWPAPTVVQQFPYQFYNINRNMLMPEQNQVYDLNHKIPTNRPGDRPVGIGSGDLYNPLVIKLDYANALRLSKTNFGYGNGIIPIKYKDRDELKGDYTIYVQIEQLADLSQKNQINVTSTENFNPILGYTLRNVNASDKVVDINNGGKEDGTFTVLYQPKGFDSQKWKFKTLGNNAYYITSMYSNKNLSVLNNAEGNGANIVTNAATETDWQVWKLIRYCDGSFILRNHKTRKVIEVYNAAKIDFAPLGQMTNNASANQRWFIEK